MPRPLSEKLIVKGQIAVTETLNCTSYIPLLGHFVCMTHRTVFFFLLFLCLVLWSLNIPLRVSKCHVEKTGSRGCETCAARRDGLFLFARDDAPSLTTGWSCCSGLCQSPLPTRVSIPGACTKKCPTSKVDSITRRISAL